MVTKSKAAHHNFFSKTRQWSNEIYIPVHACLGSLSRVRTMDKILLNNLQKWKMDPGNVTNSVHESTASQDIAKVLTICAALAASLT